MVLVLPFLIASISKAKSFDHGYLKQNNSNTDELTFWKTQSNGSTDPSYRYKMPKIIGKIEGRGNGIKTVIVNAEQVALALKRPTEQLTKYIALEFSALCYDLEGKQTINGKFETADLQNHVTSYIKRFVLCPSCGNPETVQVLQGKGKQANIVLVG